MHSLCLTFCSMQYLIFYKKCFLCSFETSSTCSQFQYQKFPKDSAYTFKIMTNLSKQEKIDS